MAQIIGKFINCMVPVSGEKDGRPWIRTQFAIMTMDTRPKVVAFDAFGEEKVNIALSLQQGQTVLVDYAPESREFALRYYTNLNVISIQVAKKVEGTQQTIPTSSPAVNQ